MNLVYSIVTTVIFSLGIQGVPYSEIGKSFEKNSHSGIVAHGQEKMLINILGKEAVYSKSQAGLVLKGFFTRKPGSQFEYTFKGNETIEGAFAIGNYTSKNEKFRVTIHFKKINENYKIESLTIEKD